MRAALRYHKNTAPVSDNRVSERGKKFLPKRRDKNDRNLSTPKYFTKMNTRGPAEPEPVLSNDKPVPVRPSFSEPIYCKTPHLTVSEPGFQRPTKGIFGSVDRRIVGREFMVNPEFVSETLRLKHVEGQSSNPLKYGWA